MSWTRERIRNKIRNLTGSALGTQISDSEINSRINDYYVFQMPAELKTGIEKRFLEFKTVPGQDVYSFPTAYFTDQPGVYVDGFGCNFYQDPDTFYQDFPEQYAVDIIGVGDAGTTVFSGTLQNPPIVISSLFISDNVSVLQSQSNGTFSGDGTGTIDYTTGIFSVTFTTPPASSENVYAKYIGFTGNRPSGCLFYENEFTFREVPDQVYQIKMQGFIVPDSLDDDSDIPLQEEWGPVIAYGTALEIFSDRSDMGSYSEIFPVYKKFEAVAMSRTLEQFSSQQSVPRF